MARGKKIEKPIDYSFMKLGGLYDAIVMSMVEACRRFGAQKAPGVISSAIFEDFNSGGADLEEFVIEEYGIELSNEDLDFLAAVVQARHMVDQTAKKLEEACNGKG